LELTTGRFSSPVGVKHFNTESYKPPDARKTPASVVLDDENTYSSRLCVASTLLNLTHANAKQFSAKNITAGLPQCVAILIARAARDPCRNAEIIPLERRTLAVLGLNGDYYWRNGS
jgi:hypothetical protein